MECHLCGHAVTHKHCLPGDLKAGDCGITISLAETSRLILSARVGKRRGELIEALIVCTEGKTNCKRLNSDAWAGHERVLTADTQHHIGKGKTQRLECTNGIVRQQTGRWHRRQNNCYTRASSMANCGRKP